MKLQVQRADLEAALNRVRGTASGASTLPALSHVLLSAEAGSLRLSATDLDVSVATSIPADVADAGAALPLCSSLYVAVRGLTCDVVDISLDASGWLVVVSGARVRVPCLAVADFPTLPDEPAQWAEVEAAPLMRAVAMVMPSISTDEGRPNLTGALLQTSADGLGVTATDGHRLASLSVTPWVGPSLDVIVPRKGLGEFVRIATGRVGAASVKGHLVFRMGATTLWVRLLDGTFPEFRSVIPASDSKLIAEFDRAHLRARLKFVAQFANSKTHTVVIEVGDGQCTLSAQDAERGEVSEQVECAYSGPRVTAGYNVRYLLDVLDVLDSDNVRVEVIDSLSPTMFHASCGVFVVMPMRL